MTASEDQYAAASADQRNRMTAAGQDLGYEVEPGPLPPAIHKRIAQANRTIATATTKTCPHIGESPQPVYSRLAQPEVAVCRRCIPLLPVDPNAPCDGCGSTTDVGSLTIRNGPLIVLATICTTCRNT